MVRQKLTPGNRLRDSKGRFVSRAYEEKVKEIKDVAAKFNPENENKPLQDFYNEDDSIENVLQGEPFERPVSIQSSTLFDEFKQAASIHINNRKVSEGVAREKILRFQQELNANYNITGIAWRPTVTHTGDMFLILPNSEQIAEFSEEPTEELILFLSEYGIEIFASDPGTSKDSKRAERDHERVSEFIDKELKKVKAKKSKKTKAAKNAKPKKKGS